MTQVELLVRVAAALDEVRAAYYVTGSFAASAHGYIRVTHDIDFVVALAPAAAGALCSRLEPMVAIDEVAAIRAARGGRHFNAIHVASGTKVDFWLTPSTPFGEAAMGRRARVDIEGVLVAVATAEDTILSKLQWHQQSGLERDLADCVGVIRCQQDRLDLDYLRRWARELAVQAALEAVLAEGRQPSS